MTTLHEACAEAMCQALKKRGLTRKELADRLGVSPPYVTAVLSGKDNPTLGQVVRILDALGFRLDVTIKRNRRAATRRNR